MAAAAMRPMQGYSGKPAAERYSAWRPYELRHRYPNTTRTVRILLNGDRAAMDFARLVRNGLGVEVWDGERLVGKM